MKRQVIINKESIKKQVAELNYFGMAEKFIAFAQVKNSSAKSYRKGIRRLADYCTVNAIKIITREVMVAYRSTLAEKYSASTANLYLTAAKLFLAFLKQENYIDINPAEHLKGLKVSNAHKKDSLSADDTKKILCGIETSTVKGTRNKTLYALMTTAGLRTIEIIRANVGDIVKTEGKYFLYVQGKGRNDKSECVEIAPNVYKPYYRLCIENNQDCFESGRI